LAFSPITFLLGGQIFAKNPNYSDDEVKNPALMIPNINIGTDLQILQFSKNG
jgi:hypothetical protein